VTLVHLMDRLMERQLDAPAAELLEIAGRSARASGILLNANTARLPWRVAASRASNSRTDGGSRLML